ncbi:Transcription factor GRAS [Corchorus capsularis]|uniref:Transcription factor GRAS n=1 Tax=Corchorus capsularis TaxID=210143 RepID=A0A1R3G618_COCAP|nr:Transcription factor GRAS [Corchorus capsularis]
MANVVFSFDELNVVGVQDKLSSSNKDFQSFDVSTEGKQSSFYGAEDWGETGGIDSLSSDYGFYRDDEGFTFSKYRPQEQPFTDYGLLDGVTFDASSPPIQTCFEEIAKIGQNIPSGNVLEVSKKETLNQYPFSISSLGLLNNYGSGFKRLNGERRIEAVNEIKLVTKTKEEEEERKVLSTEEIMRVAGEMFIQSFSCQTFEHPFNLSFSGISEQEKKDVELAVLLLAAAEKVGQQQYDRAVRLLKQCDFMSSKTGNPVQRVVYYLSEALREKIDKETGRSSSKGSNSKPLFNIDEAMMSPNPTTVACYEEMPFARITQFTGIQAIVENVGEAKKIHIFDLEIRNGMQWTVLMQSLACRYASPLELLKITAVATTAKHLREETGKRLSSFADSLNLPFAFKVVMVSDMLDLKEDMFELDAEETVAVYASFAFRMMLSMPNRIENVMKVIRLINPCIMVVTEVEANHNSPIFVNRFIEVLFFFSSYFDCLASCMKQDCKNREIIESVFFFEGIRNILAAEGEERKIRHVNFDVWRQFFARYGMEEAELSMSAMYQADLILKKFADGNCYTLQMNGKCLLVGWKGTPMHSISVWKFL